MRFALSESVGQLHFTDFLVDYRRYDPIIFNTLTFATRFLSSYSVEETRGFSRSTSAGLTLFAATTAPTSTSSIAPPSLAEDRRSATIHSWPQ